MAFLESRKKTNFFFFGMKFLFEIFSTSQIRINLFLFESYDLLLKFTELSLILFVYLFSQNQKAGN